MKRLTGRPPVVPVGDRASLSLKVSADFKRLVLAQAEGYGLSIREYVEMLVLRDVGK
jgi:hypothetical protein